MLFDDDDIDEMEQGPRLASRFVPGEESRHALNVQQDEAFCEAMLAAIAAGLERARVGTKTATDHDQYIPWVRGSVFTGRQNGYDV